MKLNSFLGVKIDAFRRRPFHRSSLTINAQVFRGPKKYPSFFGAPNLKDPVARCACSRPVFVDSFEGRGNGFGVADLRARAINNGFPKKIQIHDR